MRKMKLLSMIFLFAIIGTLFTGCTSDNEDDEVLVDNGTNSGSGTTGGNGGSVSKIPYSSWLYNPYTTAKNPYKEMTTATMMIELHLEAVHNTGTNWKRLSIMSSDGNSCLSIAESFYQYEIPTDPLWFAGTYYVGAGNRKHTYECIAKLYKGSGWFTIGGKAKISYSGNKVVIDVNGKLNNEGNTLHILHYEGTFKKK